MINKIYAVLGVSLLAGLILLYARYEVVLTQNAKYEIANRQLEKESKDKTELIVKQGKLITDANNRDIEQAKANENIKTEIDKLRTCVANHTCGVVVQFKYIETTARPAADKTDSIKSGINENAGRYGSDFESWYIDLLAAIRDNKQQIIGLQKDLVARADPSYCAQK